LSDETARHFEEQDRRDKDNRLRAVAMRIRNDLHLKTLLLKIDVKERKQVYAALRPHLRFVPLNFKQLMRLSPLSRVSSGSIFEQLGIPDRSARKEIVN
jgi:hypothetical protein